ncbi:glycosyltransferase [Mycobacterium asiaticum]|uniref:Glycosyl transferase family 1 n=1 Tax=Mycobacterium asiaticum TaxID=1790 RepID=A0A1A3BX70_MYCAS|nr:glycosyltransferase [Mycobacterium asiaticum]OBI78983.1 hypothetical protein A9X01_26720 [Mycobacterium asiaticum]
MKVAIVCGDDVFAEYNKLAGDQVGEWHLQFCAALAEHGPAVTAYPRRRIENAPEVTRRAFRTQPVSVGPTTTLPPREALPFVGEWAGELHRIWAADPPDVVHAFGWIGGLAAQLAARRLSLITVQSCHGPAPAGPADDAERSRVEPLLIRSATWMTGGSTEELDALTRLRRHRSRLAILSSGVDVKRFASTGPKSSANGMHRILQVEQNSLPRNGFDRTIQLLPKLPGAELILVQTGGATPEDRGEVERLAARLGVSDRVRFEDNVIPEELPSLMRSADVVACTAREVPQATTALQAMASGVVVVGVAAGALIDTVINGVTGLLVSPTKPHELLSALKTLQSERFTRQSMGSAGRSRALSRFSWDRIALDALTIYQQASTPELQHGRRAAGHQHSHVKI